MKRLIPIRWLFLLAAGLILALGVGGTSALAKTNLKMIFWTFQPATVQGFIDEFMKRNPDIEVVLEGASSAQYNAKAALMFRSGTPFDVMYIRDATLPLWAENGWAMPIDSCPGVAEARREMLPLAQQSQTYNGKLYGLTYYSGFYPLIINKRMMKEAGFDHAPKTFDEWVAQAKVVKQKGIAEYPMDWPIKPFGWGAMYIWADLTTTLGGKVFDENYQVTPTGMEALKWWRKTFEDGLTNPAAIEWDNSASANVFAQGQAYTLLSLNIYAGNQWANNPEKSKVVGEAMLAQPPGNGSTIGFTAMYGINAATKNKEAACKLVQFLGGKDKEGKYITPKAWVEAAALTWGERGVEKDPGVRKSLESWGADPDVVAGYLDKAVHLSTVVPYQKLWYFEWQDYADKLLQEILSGRLAPEEGARQMTERAKLLEARYKK